MKINPKVYKNLTGEPFKSEEIDGNTVSFYDMNETQYLSQYAGRGKFAIWTSGGGNDYKVLIEKSYYEALKPFYEYEINKIWLGFLTEAESINKRYNKLFLIPMLSIYLVVLVAFSFIAQGAYLSYAFIGLIAAALIANMAQTRVVSKKIRDANYAAQDKIKNAIGDDEFDRLVQAQDAHYKAYFKFEDNEEVSEETVEIIENKEEKDK